jgi:hypothetical protein
MFLIKFCEIKKYNLMKKLVESKIFHTDLARCHSFYDFLIIFNACIEKNYQ